jgi:endonuclease/exonuclease/phosphatase (EEP) superfamily protein YafD
MSIKPEPTLKIVLWNIEWRRRNTPAGREIRRRVDAHAPDVVCLTEGHEDFLADSGHVIGAAANYGLYAKPGRRKVMLWSRTPWTGADDRGSADLPGGRYVAASTQTSVGHIQVMGVCIPWAFSNVNLGSRDKKPWEDHGAYLHGLAALLPSIIARGPTVVLGDFNQTIPRTRAPNAMADLLAKTLPETLLIPTAGSIPEIERPSIDHIAHTDDLETVAVRGISNIWDGGRRLSDHFGLAIELRQRPREQKMQPQISFTTNA